MSLYQDLRAGGYLDPTWGMVSIYNHNGKPTPNCSNYWLFTAIARTLLPKGGGWTNIDEFYAACMIKRGLIARFPTLKDQDISQQEIAGCAVLGYPFALSILSYARRNWFCFNAENPGVFSWNYFYARFLDFIPFITMSAGGFLSPIGQGLWSIGVITTTMTAYDNTSEKVYKWMQVENIKGKHWITDATIWVWKKLMIRKYGTPRELFAIYFPPNHPFVAYAPAEF